MDPRIWVFCDFAFQDAIARENGGQYFCSLCGSTEHETAVW